MSEIEKMYENANVKKDWNSTPYGGIEEYYPPFTAEKQIEILKFLFAKDVFKCYQHYTSKAYIVLRDNARDFICNKPFNEFLASYINCIWQSLTDKEKQQVKGILE